MARIAVFLHLSEDDLQQGWGGNIAELEASIKATLHEINGDDGGVYVPHVFGIEVDDDD